MNYVSLLALVLVPVLSYAQDQLTYQDSIDRAWQLYEARDYAASAKTYNSAFRQNGDLGAAGHRYDAACSWALAGQPDSAFHHLTRIAEKGNYTNLGHITTDGDLDALHGDPRWTTVITQVKANKAEAEKDFDKPLVAQLDSIFDLDQVKRREVMKVSEEYGWGSDEMKALWREIAPQDSLNVIAVRKILDERGWLGADVVGGKGNQTLFLVIQHADIEIQEEYLPMMRQAVADGRAKGSALALLEDRVALRRGGKQIYGSQIGRDPITDEPYVDDLEDPDKVDARRASVGLGPIAEYTRMMGFEWDLGAYRAKAAARALVPFKSQ